VKSEQTISRVTNPLTSATATTTAEFCARDSESAPLLTNARALLPLIDREATSSDKKDEAKGRNETAAAGRPPGRNETEPKENESAAGREAASILPTTKLFHKLFSKKLGIL
jgi:hypothetical protein